MQASMLSSNLPRHLDYLVVKKSLEERKLSFYASEDS